ncbi:metallophosphoesterase [Pseudooceanicola sp. LIPI14-2-Ac024]|uniref:metallophosphoesterase n=1 Tax=Pseudooceanicola sp. LIPI14-2-Ac024 TaxID=3344875 RepID=UPI0035CFCBC6
MKFMVISDLHLDLWNKAGRDPFSDIEQDIAELEVLILAGDVTNKPTIRWRPAFTRLAQMLPAERISVFPGNHDYYQFRIDEEERLAEIAGSSGVNYVNCEEIIMGSTRFLCATLWTDFDLGKGRTWNEDDIPEKLNDYRLIRVANDGYRALAPKDVIHQHRLHLQWLGNKLREEFSGKTIVVTHHAPHPAVLGAHSHGVEAAYASDLGDFIKEHRPHTWLFGHCHDAVDTVIGETRVLNVSLGYPHEVAEPGKRIKSLIRST